MTTKKGLLNSKLFRVGIALLLILGLVVVMYPAQSAIHEFFPELSIGMIGEAGAETADYECDGTDDDVQVQAALDALPAGGGKLYLLSGSYSFGATVTRAIDNVTIQGNGRSSYIAYDASTAIFDDGGQDNWLFINLATDAGGITATGTSSYIVASWIGGIFTDDSGQRAATFVVAASDSLHPYSADYVCDGTADNVQIQAAIDAVAALGAGRVQLSEGTFYIAAAIEITEDNLSLVGQGKHITVLEMAANDNAIEITSAVDLAVSRLMLQDFGINGKKATYSGHGIVISCSYRSMFSRLHIYDCKLNGLDISSSGTHGGGGNAYEYIEIIGCDGDGVHAVDSPEDSVFHYMYIASVGGSQFYMADASENHIVHCHFGGTNGGNAIMELLNCNHIVVEDNWFSALFTDTAGIFVDPVAGTRHGIIIANNILHGNGGGTTKDAIVLYGTSTGVQTQTIVTGNVMKAYRFGVNIFNSDIQDSVVTGNNMLGCTIEPKLIDLGLRSNLQNNLGVGINEEKSHVIMKNTHGSTIDAGMVVRTKAAASGDEVGLTNIQGNDWVFGMADEELLDNAYGSILLTGFTTRLKVNGTVDISSGNLLGCHTDMGIAMKASAGDMVFAIAREAYTADNSNGVIDAVLITPRKI